MKKPNIRILLNGEERVVSPYFPLPPNAIVLDPRPQSSKRRAKKSQKSSSPNAIVLDPRPQSSKRRAKKSQKSSTLSAAEKRLDIYKRVSQDNAWVAPRSPYKLLQEDHSYDPWRVLIICMLLNRTSGTQVKGYRVLSKLFKMCPNAEAAANAQEADLINLIRPLGLYNKRAVAIKKLSSQYLGSEWTHVTELYGVGKYGADAYAIFCVGKPEEVTPIDHKLVDYWKYVCKNRAQ